MKSIFGFFESGKVFLLTFFACLLALNYLTPMHSDDYTYKMIGLDFQSHYNHYMGWSGRIFANLVAPSILLLENKFVISIVQSIGFFSLFFIVSKTSSAFSLGKDECIWKIVFLSSLAFLSMPVFGQVALWVVGSANYLWTAVIYSLFVLFMIRYLYNGNIPFYFYPLSLVAGCTNENAGVAILFLSLLVFFWKFLADKKIDYKLMVVIFFLMIGIAILVGAPGNQNRLLHPAFEWWNSLTFLEKIEYHFTQRFFGVFENSELAYLLSLALIAIGLFRKNVIKFFDDELKPSYLTLSVIFFIMSIISNGVMLFSPSMAPRSMMVPFVFILFSISFGVYSLGYNLRLKILKSAAIFLSLVSFFFMLSVIPTYQSLADQESVRNIIMNISKRNDENVVVPDFYQEGLPLEDDGVYGLDNFYNTAAIAKYHGLKKVKRKKINFDYSFLLNGETTTSKAFYYSSKGDLDGGVSFIGKGVNDAGENKSLRITLSGDSDNIRKVCLFKNLKINNYRFFYKEVNGSDGLDIASSELVPTEECIIGSESLNIFNANGFSVYLDGDKISFLRKKSDVTENEDNFFLHVFPKSRKSLKKGRENYGFNNLDFSYVENMSEFGDFLFIERELPGYAIEEIKLGQFNEKGRVWFESYVFPD